MILLYRIDERLVHGQVVLAWGRQLRADRYLVVDDDLATTEWEQELYRLGAGEAEALFATVREARTRIARWKDDGSRSVLLTRNVSTMRKLGAGGALRGCKVNVGGLHSGFGRKRRLSYVHLSEEDEALLREIDAGARVVAQDLPEAPPVDLASLLG